MARRKRTEQATDKATTINEAPEKPRPEGDVVQPWTPLEGGLLELEDTPQADGATEDAARGAAEEAPDDREDDAQADMNEEPHNEGEADAEGQADGEHEAERPAPSPEPFDVEEGDNLVVRAREALVAKFDIDAVSELINELKAAAARAFDWARHLDRQLIEGETSLMTRAEMCTNEAAVKDAFGDARRMERAHDMLDKAALDYRAEQHRAAMLQIYRDVEQSRDDLADEITSEYPKLAARFRDLAWRIMVSNTEIARLNGCLPEGCEPLRTAEAAARGWNDAGGDGVGSATAAFRIVQAQIPDFEPDSVAWPPVAGRHYWQHSRSGKVLSYGAVKGLWRTIQSLLKPTRR
ncbi:MAG: hypothetical protein CMI67_10615 [Pelagibaca sp.]|nr:hypothetical protein [Pelagibaca sp.]